MAFGSLEIPMLRNMNPESFLELHGRYREYLFKCRKLWIKPASITKCLNEEQKKQFKYLILQNLERNYEITDYDVEWWILKVKNYYYGITEEVAPVVIERACKKSRSEETRLEFLKERVETFSGRLDKVENTLMKFVEYLGNIIESEESKEEDFTDRNDCEFLEKCEDSHEDAILEEKLRRLEVNSERPAVELTIGPCEEKIELFENKQMNENFVYNYDCRFEECILDYEMLDGVKILKEDMKEITKCKPEINKVAASDDNNTKGLKTKLVEKYPIDRRFLWEIKVTVGD